MSMESVIADLTSATTALTEAVNVRKAVLDAAAAASESSASQAAVAAAAAAAAAAAVVANEVSTTAAAAASSTARTQALASEQQATQAAQLSQTEASKAQAAAAAATAANSAAQAAAETIPLARRETAALGKVAAWQSEMQAEILRGAGQSGVYRIRQYTYGGPNAFDRPFTESFNPISTHNHPDQDITPGTAEFSMIVNGYYLRTRHNDYMLKSPAPVGSAFLDLVKIHPPAVPASVTNAGNVVQQIAAMRQLFARYKAGEMPEGFAWTMSYVEVWFEPLSEIFQDTFDSPRHEQRITDLDTAFREITRYNAGGYKDRLENVPFEPPVVRWIENGKPVLARMRYRIAAVDVSSLGDLRNMIKPMDDLAYEAGFDRPSTRWVVDEWRTWPHTLDDLMAKVPGLDGAGANLTETYADYGTTTTIKSWGGESALNAAYYSRFGVAKADASGRDSIRRGFNDPKLFVASTTRPEVLPMTIDGITYRFSYAFPFELILRTPLETWNPYDLPQSEEVTGAGTQADPFTGWRGNGFNYRVPSAFYSGSAPGDLADTGTADAWVKDKNGIPRSVKGSGIYLELPWLQELGNIRLRHHIYPVHQEGGYAHAQMQALRRNHNEVMVTIAKCLIQTQISCVSED